MGWYDIEGDKFNCEWYGDKKNCEFYGDDYANFGTTANSACCVCGGGVTNGSPSEIPSLSPSATWSPTPIPAAASRALGTGNHHTCAIFNNPNQLKCWGWNAHGQVGDGTTENRRYPVEVSLGAGRYAVFVALGNSHSCAITNDNKTFCWGFNNERTLGAGANMQIYSSPIEATIIPSDEYAIALALGEYFTCAILNDRSVGCWGSFWDERPGGRNGALMKADLGGPDNKAKDIAAGWTHTCAILTDNTLKCWGRNNYGQVGDGTLVNKPTPTTITLPDNKYAIAMGLSAGFTCVVTNDNAVYCWGSNQNKALGATNVHMQQRTPLEVDLNEDGMGAISISCAESTPCAIMTDEKTVKCWGGGTRGDLTYGNQAVPQKVQHLGHGNETVTMIEMGLHHGCALLDGSEVWCWGRDSSGQLGIGDDGDGSSRNYAVFVTEIHNMTTTTSP